MQGYERAKAARADEVAIFGSASEGFSRANINATIEESLARFAPVVEARGATGYRCGAMSPAWWSVPMTGRSRRGRSRGWRRGSARWAATRSRSATRSGAVRRRRSTPCSPPCWRRFPRSPRGAFPRHVRPGARQYRGGAGPWPAGLRCRRGRVGRLPLCARRGGQRGDGGGGRAAGRWATRPGSTRVIARAAQMARAMRAGAAMADVFRSLERLMAMDDRVWRRHANPWSGWTRVTALPLLVLAIWSRVWIGWWAMLAVWLVWSGSG
jgi:hypothetical protein